jgi:hypothetical protein
LRINRLSIPDIPVPESRFFWSGTRVRRGNTPIEIAVNLGIERSGTVKPCRFLFTYQGPELIYAKPDAEILHDEELLKYASQLNFNLLYPISAILSGASADTEEPLVIDGRIHVLLGQGQTAQVLRNICYKVAFERGGEGEADWEKITQIMNRLFLVSLNKPQLIPTRGSFILTYKQQGIDNDLEISLAGRGMQQTLLILAYIFWHKNSVILVDEPDAHLEILRQKQIYAILNHVAEENNSQVIIATHSEAILDEAVETNLSLLLNGIALNVAADAHRGTQIRNALQNYGIEHYYKAKINPGILIVEGSTDKEILKELAKHLKHEKAAAILDGTLNVYYSRNTYPERNFENAVDRASGAFGNPKQYFYALKYVIPGLKAFGIYDRDKSEKQDEMTEDFAFLYWQDYEIENYFISPDVLMNYAAARFAIDIGELYKNPYAAQFKEVLDEVLLEKCFNGNKRLMDEYFRLFNNMYEKDFVRI